MHHLFLNIQAALLSSDFLQKISDYFKSINIDSYQDMMNPSIWSSQSLEGLIVMILIVLLVYKFIRKAYKFAAWCIGAIFMIQVFYVLGGTVINNYIPLRAIFPYDIMQSIAQLCVGTKLSYALLWIDELFNKSFSIFAEAMVSFVKAVFRIFKNADPLKN